MLSIKDTISRIGRSIRQVESLTQSSNPKSPIKLPATKPCLKVIPKTHTQLSNEGLNQLKPLYTDFQRKVFQDFLKPLNIPNLKTFCEKVDYNNREAKQNWLQKTSTEPQDVLDTFIKHRYQFKRLMKYLLAITPSHLKGILYSNVQQIQHILQEEEKVQLSLERPKIPHNTFHEIPPLPSPLTKESFEEYIFKLTHSKYHYKNSLSLQSGIIPQILLHTHKLSNEKFKPFRSTATFNHLIKYFGYDKNQSLFARELLLVMNNDGHVADFGTINNLLCVVKLHSRIRSNTSSYRLALKYLKFGHQLGVQVNLSTWTRIYDIIDNVYLKEQFLNTLQEKGIPILRPLLLRILKDFSKTTKKTKDVIYFIENDLGMKNWQEDGLVRGQVLCHQALNYGEDSAQPWLNEFDFKNWLQGLKENENFKGEKSIIMLKQYFARDFEISETLPIFAILIQQLVSEFLDIRHLKQLVFVVRGLIYEATNQLGIPVEVDSYGDGNYSIPENYKILARNLQDALPMLQAKIEFINKFSYEKLPLPWEWLSDQEVQRWEALKQKFKISNTELFPLLEGTSLIPQEELVKIMNHIKAKGIASRNRSRVEMVKMGFDGYTLNRMKDRGLI